MPYLLPDGDAFEPNLKCAIVFYPDRDEYRRALWGAISQLTKWWMWERDEEKRGADAADSWDLAYEATMENFGMLDQILDAIDEVEDLLRALQFIGACCPEVDVTEGDQHTDPVEDDVGDVPQPIVDAGYADDTADWSSFQDYKCMIAHVLVEDVVQGLTMLAPFVNAAGVIFGGLATVTAIALAIIGSGGTALITGLIGGVGLAAELYELITDRDFVEDAADAIADCKDDLVCAFMSGDGPQASKDAMDAEADSCLLAPYAAIFKLWSYPAKVKGLYAGRYDQEQAAQILADRGYTVDNFTCCAEGGFLLHDYTPTNGRLAVDYGLLEAGGETGELFTGTVYKLQGDGAGHCDSRIEDMATRDPIEKTVTLDHLGPRPLGNFSEFRLRDANGDDVVNTTTPSFPMTVNGVCYIDFIGGYLSHGETENYIQVEFS